MTLGEREARAPRRGRLGRLHAFCETVRRGSLSGAATALGSSQPTVSNQVRALEEELGVALVRHQGVRIAPTRVGRSLYRSVVPLVEGLRRVPALFEEQHRDRMAHDPLRIGAGEVSGGCLLPRLVRRFQARYPEVPVVVRTGTGEERLAWLRAFELDVVALAMDFVPDDIAFHPLVRTDAVVVMPEDHPLAGCESVPIEALAGQALVAPLGGRGLRRSHDLVFRLHGVRPHVVVEVEDWGAMLNCVAAGVGVAVAPALSVAPHEAVRAVALEHRYPLRTYGLAQRRDGLVPRAARCFVEAAVSGPGDGDEVP